MAKCNYGGGCKGEATHVVVRYVSGKRAARAPRGACLRCATSIIADSEMKHLDDSRGSRDVLALLATRWRAEYLS